MRGKDNPTKTPHKPAYYRKFRLRPGSSFTSEGDKHRTRLRFLLGAASVAEGGLDSCRAALSLHTLSLTRTRLCYFVECAQVSRQLRQDHLLQNHLTSRFLEPPSMGNAQAGLHPATVEWAFILETSIPPINSTSFFGLFLFF